MPAFKGLIPSLYKTGQLVRLRVRHVKFLKIQNWRFVHYVESRVKPKMMNSSHVGQRIRFTLIRMNVSFDSLFADHVIIFIQLKCICHGGQRIQEYAMT